MDWAEELIARKQSRGETHQTAEDLRNKVIAICLDNVERWRGERWNTEEERLAVVKEENERLIRMQKEEDDREQLEFDWGQKGIKVEADYSQQGKIRSVKLPFTPSEWADLLNAEGEYLPACCAEISRIRDILGNACRNDHYIEVNHLCEATFLARHHGFEQDENHPVSKMLTLWDKIEKDARSYHSGNSVNVEDPNDALEILCSSANVIKWNELFSKDGVGKNIIFDRHVNRSYALATIQLAVRALFFKLKELDHGSIEGYGLIDENGKIGLQVGGVAIFRTEELAKEICKRWNKESDTYSIKKTYSVKKVRVSLEKGVETLADDHPIRITQDVADTEDPEPVEID